MVSTLDDRPLARDEDLLEIFHAAEKPATSHRVGAEAEKFGVFRGTGAPLHYDDPSGRSVLAFLHGLVAEHGWTPEPESPGGPLIALRRGRAAVTLEPGGQLELSGSPCEDIHQIAAELRGHLAEIRATSERLGIAWLGVGFHPFARQQDLDWVPKARYGIMQRYLPTRGRYGLDMMRRTATVQANFDFADEADALRKLRVGLRLAPLTVAMFANSPFFEGKASSTKSHRARVWTSVDEDRSGLVPGVWHEAAGYHDYVAWALTVPMFLLKRHGEVVANTGQTFGDFLKNGFGEHRATYGDWEMHLNTLFPEVRLKRTLEIRGADSLPLSLACALPALFTGLFYDARALDAIEALTADLSYDEVAALRAQVPDRALLATFRGAPLATFAERVLDIASGGLARRARRDGGAEDERVHLAGLVELVSRGLSPADVLLQDLPADAAPDEIIRRASVA